MKVLSEETDFFYNVAMLKNSHRKRLFPEQRIQCYMLRENVHSLRTERSSVEITQFITTVRAFMKFLWVISEVDKKT